MKERDQAGRWLLVVVALAAAYWIFDLAILRCGTPHPLDDTWEDGLVARGLLAGQWFRTPMLYPPLWGLRDPATQTLPVLIHGPVLPLLVAPVIALFGPAALDRMAWLGAGFAWLTVIPIVRLGSRHFGAPVGVAAALLFTISPLTLVAVHHYASVVLGALLVTLGLDLAARPRPRALAAGIVMGWAYLARPEMLPAALAVAWLAAAQSESSKAPRAAATVLLAVAVTASWWWWHHASASGNPLFNLSSYIFLCFSPAHPGDHLVRDFAASPERLPGLIAAAWPSLPEKWAALAPRALRNLLISPTGATGWLVPIGCAVALARRDTRRLAVCGLVIVAIPTAAMVLMVQIRHYLVPALPLFALAAALGARWLFERLPPWAHRPRAWTLALLLAALPSVIAALGTERREAAEARALLADERRELARVTPPDAELALRRRLMFSDRPDFTAWSTGRPTLWIESEELVRLERSPHRLPEGWPEDRSEADTWFHAGHWARGTRLPAP